MPIVTSTSCFTLNGRSLGTTMANFFEWCYSDTAAPTVRSALAEYIVASALGVVGSCVKRYAPSRAGTIYYQGYCLEIKSAAYIESNIPEFPGQILFKIQSHTPDAYVFCVFKGIYADDSPLNLDLWDFYIAHPNILNECHGKSISLSKLISIGPLPCNYNSLADAILSAV